MFEVLTLGVCCLRSESSEIARYVWPVLRKYFRESKRC
jgi:hypothetical protein